jgi:hypothetical protein
MINTKIFKVFLKTIFVSWILLRDQYKVVLNDLELKFKENFLVAPFWKTGAPFGELP